MPPRSSLPATPSTSSMISTQLPIAVLSMKWATLWESLESVAISFFERWSEAFFSMNCKFKCSHTSWAAVVLPRSEQRCRWRAFQFEGTDQCQVDHWVRPLWTWLDLRGDWNHWTVSLWSSHRFVRDVDTNLVARQLVSEHKTSHLVDRWDSSTFVVCIYQPLSNIPCPTFRFLFRDTYTSVSIHRSVVSPALLKNWSSLGAKTNWISPFRHCCCNEPSLIWLWLEIEEEEVVAMPVRRSSSVSHHLPDGSLSIEVDHPRRLFSLSNRELSPISIHRRHDRTADNWSFHWSSRSLDRRTSRSGSCIHPDPMIRVHLERSERDDQHVVQCLDSPDMTKVKFFRQFGAPSGIVLEPGASGPPRFMKVW